MTARKPLIALILALHANAWAGWLDEAGLELRHDNNLSRAQLAQDIKGDNAWLFSTAGGTAYQLADGSRIKLAVTLTGSDYQRYDGLDNLNLGLQLAYRRKFGLGPYVPELQLSMSATRLDYRDALRDGWLAAADIGIGKRLSDRASIKLAYQVEQRRSDKLGARVLPRIAADVFNLTSGNLSIGGEYSLHPQYVLSSSYSRRDGDIVSTTLRNLPVFLASSAIAADPVFGPERYAYKMKALTRGLTLGVSRIIGAQASLTLGFEHLDSRATGGIDYTSNLVRATYLHQF